MPSSTITLDGIDYDVADPIIDVDGTSFATGLWIPHERESITLPMALLAETAGIRDHKDITEILANPFRTAAATMFPPKLWTRSQGQVGSCAGYAGAGALARARVWAGMEPVFLSGESLYAQTNGGRDRGSGLINNIKAMMKVGVAPEGLNTPGKFYSEGSLPEAAKKERHRFRVLEYHQVSTPFELAAAAALQFVIGVAIHVGGAWQRMNGDVLVGNSGPGNHAVLVDDVRATGTDSYEYRMVNSHGLRWGQEGVAWTRWGAHYASTVRNHVFYAIRAVCTDPESPQPPKLGG